MWPICFYSTHDDWSDGKMPPSPAGWGCRDLLWAVLITGPSWCKFGVWFYCELLPLLCLSFSPCRRGGSFPWVMLLRLPATAYVSGIAADRLNLNISDQSHRFAITVMCTQALGGSNVFTAFCVLGWCIWHLCFPATSSEIKFHWLLVNRTLWVFVSFSEHPSVVVTNYIVTTYSTERTCKILTRGIYAAKCYL